MHPTNEVLLDVMNERISQDKKWGEQNHPDGTGRRCDESNAENRRLECEKAKAAGELSWREVLAEEVAEVFAETDEAKLRAELVQVAAVAVAWIEALDRRKNGSAA